MKFQFKIIVISLTILMSFSCRKKVENRVEKKIEKQIKPFKFSIVELHYIKPAFDYYIITDSSFLIYTKMKWFENDSFIVLDTNIRNTGVQKIIDIHKIENWESLFNDNIIGGQDLKVSIERDTFYNEIFFSNSYYEPLKNIIDSMNLLINDNNDKLRYKKRPE